eukprot:scaffold12797_cov129-Isochrysis_galbana.AAC.7
MRGHVQRCAATRAPDVDAGARIDECLRALSSAGAHECCLPPALLRVDARTGFDERGNTIQVPEEVAGGGERRAPWAVDMMGPRGGECRDVGHVTELRSKVEDRLAALVSMVDIGTGSDERAGAGLAGGGVHENFAGALEH